MKTEIKPPVMAAIIVLVLVIIGVVTYFTLFNERKLTPEEVAAHMGAAAQRTPGQAGNPGARPGPAGGAPTRS